MSDKHDPSIQIVPPICGTTEAPNPQYVDLTMQIKLHHGHDEHHGELSEADRTQYNFWTVAESVCDQLHRMIQHSEGKHWPDGALTVAATTLLIADVALQQWRREQFAECLVTCTVAARGEAELAKLLED